MGHLPEEAWKTRKEHQRGCRQPLWTPEVWISILAAGRTAGSGPKPKAMIPLLVSMWEAQSRAMLLVWLRRMCLEKRKVWGSISVETWLKATGLKSRKHISAFAQILNQQLEIEALPQHTAPRGLWRLQGEKANQVVLYQGVHGQH